jgi:hypothetical protein
MLSELKRKTLPAIAKAVGADAQALHHVVAYAPWSVQEVRKRRLTFLRQALAGRSYHFLVYTDVMQKRLAVKPHLSLEEVEQQSRKAKDPVARSHWQIVWLLAQGKKTKQIVEYTGYGLSWIRTIAHRYNEGGPQADGVIGAMAILVRQRSCHLNNSSNCGRRYSLLLPIRVCGQAGKWLPGSRIKLVVRCIHSADGNTSDAWVEPCVCHVRVMPKPIRLSKTPFKKLPEVLDQVQQAAPEATVELWAFDEHRIGLKPILRRVWVFNGQRPTVVVQHR